MKTGRDYKDVERLQYEIAPHSSYYAAVTDADRRHIPPLVAPPCILQARSASRSRLAGWPPASCCGHKGNDVVRPSLHWWPYPRPAYPCPCCTLHTEYLRLAFRIPAFSDVFMSDIELCWALV